MAGLNPGTNPESPTRGNATGAPSDLRQQQASGSERRSGESCTEGGELGRRAEEVLDARAERRSERERDLERGRPPADSIPEID